MPADISDDATPRLNLPYLAAAQAQKHVTLNEALSMLDGLVQTSVASRSIAAQPEDAEDGALHILPLGRTGTDWSLLAPGALARFEAGGWSELATVAGALAYVEDEASFVVRAGDGWRALGEALGDELTVERLGLGTTADAANPFAAKLNRLLFAARTVAEGGDGDLRFTINKEAVGDVLSLVFQSGYAARAEIGLVGGDDLTVRVSPDGAGWLTALAVARSSGRVGVGEAAPKGVLHTRSVTDRTIIQSDSPAMRSSLLLLNGDAGPASGSGMLFAAGGDALSTGFIGGLAAERTDADQNAQSFLRVLSGGALTAPLILRGGASGPTIVAHAKVGVGLAEPKARLDVDGAVRVKSHTVAGLPSAAAEGAGAILFVSNEAGGPTLAFSDGASWRRVADRAVVA